MTLPRECLVDTNVPKVANYAINLPKGCDVPMECIKKCVDAVDHIIKKHGLIIDSEDEIFEEYLRNLSLSGEPGMGDAFMKWVHDNRWILGESQRVKITKNGKSYDKFPDHSKLVDFDKADHKFVAVANAHPEKPPILQATDSK